MNADHERLKAVLAEAAAQANPAERAVYLDDACRGDPEFRARVEALLRAHDRAGGFLEEPVVTTPPKNQVVSPGLTEKPGDWIGRDIKPSNILVTLHDGVPMPVVIAFGIAKATALQPLTDKTLFTAFEQFIGTPAYMSPEQAELSRLDIDTRSDIYALGVLLYELLTGKTPFDTKTLLAAGLDEMRRIIREQEPVRPSTRITQEMNNSQSQIQNPKSNRIWTGS